MAMVINSNIMSLNAQNQLTKTNNDLNTAMERLTSGKRINSAADDAAGLAISNRMTSQVRGLDQAVRNANDGISLIQTAEGALEESTNILQRMRELSIQSANGTYSEGNRSTLNAEVKQLVSELDRISETSAFNGQKILDGSLGSVALQVGSEANETISFEIQAMDSKSLGLGSTTSDITGARIDSTGSYNIAEGGVEINGQSLSSISNLGGTGATDTQLQDVLDDINNNIEGVSASAYNTVQADTAGTGVISSTETLRITLGSIDGSADVNYDISNTANMDELVDKINSTTGGTVTASLDDNGRLQLANSTGGTITASFDTDNTDNGGAFNTTADTTLDARTGITSGGDGTQGFTGSIALTSDTGEAITVTAGASGSDADLEALGFRSIQGAGVVVGEELAADNTEQSKVLAANDLKINGVAISAVAEDGTAVDTLAEKVANINAVSDETGVTASIVAEKSFAADVDKAVTTVTGTAAISAANITTIAAYADATHFTVNGVGIDLNGVTDANDLADTINTASPNTGVTASITDDGKITFSSESPITFGGASYDPAHFGGGTGASGTANTATTLGANSGSLNINGVEISNIDLNDLDAAVKDINTQSGNTGVTASIDDNGQLKFEGTSQVTIQAGQTAGQASAMRLGIEFASDSSGDGANDTLVLNPRIKLDSANDQSISVEVTTNGADATGLSNMNSSVGAQATGSAIASLDISTVAGAQKAIGSIDNALDTINQTRGDLGAVNNRLDFTINNLSSISENVSAARSRIEDADFAKESANLSRSQVLQQAGTSMLAQANAAPQQVLSLLQ